MDTRDKIGETTPQNISSLQNISSQSICDNNNQLNNAKIQAKKQQSSNIKKTGIQAKSGSITTRNQKPVKLLPVTKLPDSSSSLLHPKLGEKGYTTRKKIKFRINNLWSVWYGLFGTLLQAYISVKALRRLLRYSILPWKNNSPIFDVHVSMVVTFIAIILLPIFLLACLFKVGNLANDGKKLGRKKITRRRTNNSFKNLYKFGGPIAAILHLIIAICFLTPKLIMESRLIEYNFLPMENVWRSDLDFLFVPKDRLVVLSFMTSDNKNATMGNNTAMSSALTNGNQSIFEAKLSQNFVEEIYVFLRDLFKITDKNFDINIDHGFGSTVSVEFMNYSFALLVYQVRFCAQFWFANKCLTLIFSIFLFMNSVTSLFGYAGVSILYKIQQIGAHTLPYLKSVKFILNPCVTLLFLLISLTLILFSSLVLSFFAHGRYNSYLSGRPIPYLKTHLAGLVTLLATVTTLSPLINDLTIAYKGSLDISIITTITMFGFCLIIWLIVWIILHLSREWRFKVVTQIGKQVLRSPISMKRVFDLELSDCSENRELLVFNNGIAYPIKERLNKNRIMTLVQNSNEHIKLNKQLETPDTEIYWPRNSQTPDKSPQSPHIKCWGAKKSSLRPRYNVKFQEPPTSESKRGSPVDDEGDYATLRMPEGILKTSKSLDTVSDDKVLESCFSGSPTYISASSPEPPILNRSSPPTPPKCLSSPSGLGSLSGGETSSSTSSGVHSSTTGGTRAASITSLANPAVVPGTSQSISGTNKPQIVSLKHKIIEQNETNKQPYVTRVTVNKTPTETTEGETVLVNTRPQQGILGIPVIVENSNDIVVIRRKDPDYSISGRSTNMKMQTFTESENKNSLNTQTLPHFPTQKTIGAYPGCSTMPLPQQQHPPQTGSAGNLTGNIIMRQHTTLPTHFSGVKITPPNNKSAPRYYRSNW